MKPQPKYNRPKDEAARIGISVRELSNWRNDKVIPFIQIGRVILYDPEAVDKALAKLQNP